MEQQHDHGYGTLGNPGNQIANRLAALDDGACSSNFFSALIGLNTATTSLYLQGKKPVPDAVYSLMLETIKYLSVLIEKARPLHVDFRPCRADQYRQLLRKLKEGELFVNVWETASTPEGMERQRRELQAALDALGTAREPEPPVDEIEIVAQPVEPKAPPVSNHRPLVKNFG